jgi:cytoskeletal protein CcmA (bactofilin family)
MKDLKGATTMQDRAHTPADSALNALLGRGSEFDGKLNFEGTVRIDGTFTGEISTNDMLIIGEGAKVTADISCGSVVVNGEVTGNIKATDMVELHKPAKVKGDITTPSLMVDKGVQFDGTSKMDSTASNLVTLNRREGTGDRP